jgi:hypothetical protein
MSQAKNMAATLSPSIWFQPRFDERAYRSPTQLARILCDR